MSASSSNAEVGYLGLPGLGLQEGGSIAASASYTRWRAANRDKALAATKRWKEENPEKYASSKRNARLKAEFGITSDEYEELHTAQAGLCAICSQPETEMRLGKVKRLAVDHCHLTGLVRGLLCGACNKGLGSFRDSPERLVAAAKYVS